jgi:hypothetical protein
MLRTVFFSVSLMASVYSLSANAAPDTRTYEGKALYKYHQRPGPLEQTFSRLEQRGVEKEAEMDAVAKCETASRGKCYPVAVRSHCNYRIPPKSVFDTGSTACSAVASAATARDLQ